MNGIRNYLDGLEQLYRGSSESLAASARGATSPAQAGRGKGGTKDASLRWPYPTAHVLRLALVSVIVRTFFQLVIWS